MLRLIFALTALAASAAPIAAQTPLQKCRAMTDSAERLKCFDTLQAEPAYTLAAAQPAGAPAQSSQPAQPARTRPGHAGGKTRAVTIRWSPKPRRL